MNAVKRLALPLLLLLAACDSGPGEAIELSEAVEGTWHETWSQRVGGFIVIFEGECEPLPSSPCTAYEPELIESETALELRAGRFTATTRSHYFLNAEDRMDTLRTGLIEREGRYEIAGDTLVFVREEATEPYAVAVVGDSLHLRDAACDLAVEGFCPITLGEVGLPWASAPGLLKKSGTMGRE